MSKNIETVEVRKLDKFGVDTKNEKDVRYYRLSIYFDYKEDNHHIQFTKETPRHEVVALLGQLAGLINIHEETKDT